MHSGCWAVLGNAKSLKVHLGCEPSHFPLQFHQILFMCLCAFHTDLIYLRGLSSCLSCYSPFLSLDIYKT